MSLPPGFLDELRTRLTLSDVVGRKVMWDKRKSQPGKGDMWAPCPFHHEKTASFHVDDRKGFYYCFGCHAKGDAISFVKDTENVGFMEAVEILAGEAGLQMPARDPRAQEKADRRTQLAEVMEMAVAHFRLMLKTAAGAAARDYLAGRGLDDAAQERWGIGFAPDLWQGLWDHLKGKGVADDLILGAGLAKPSQKGGNPYDTFRGRIMFPIRDARGRCIAFGGRAMDPNDNAKYLNSPETELFDKGRNLYNVGPARAASGKGQPLIVAEGYMDVIALSEAGFASTVAPLGTAITEQQLHLMWRIHPEPVIALDGDTAGLRAAMRVIDLALPLLEAGKGLRFAIMPEGQDPDDLIKAQGPQAMQAALNVAVPMVDLLWRRETEGRVFDSPERKAALDKDLREVISRISDPSIRAHYAQAIKDMRWDLFRARPKSGKTDWNNKGDWKARRGSGKAQNPVLPTTKSSLLAGGSSEAELLLSEAVVLAVLVLRPDLLEGVESRLERIEMRDREHAEIQRILLSHALDGEQILRDEICNRLGAACLEKLFALNHVKISAGVRQPEDTEIAEATVMSALRRLEALPSVQSEVGDAARDLDGVADEGVTWRLAQAAEARNRATVNQTEDKTTFERAANGLLISREEKDVFDRMLAGLSLTKGKDGGS
ncbi:DNA primase [Aliiroseovarius crassostreae]|uniref:DNA primase n=1 Tax=Aliiroseovarius crassostreae TaxID=154981 RepID=UPI0021AFF960|nr:DNA primase [Aliiroseovarius crassostreae]UWQ06839.1 DNA primase [Aliiroseovarius crassostreae]UWQ09941.1 DNA primase [Aliiroseovarius crassostreae]